MMPAYCIINKAGTRKVLCAMNKSSIKPLGAVLSIPLLLLGSSVFAEEIKTKDDLETYLREQLPANHLLTAEYEIGQQIGTTVRRGSCKTKDTVKTLPTPFYILLKEKLAKVKIAKDDPWASAFDYSCVYEITSFAETLHHRWKQMDIEVRSMEDFVDKVTIPLTRQDLLGIEDVNIGGYDSGSGLTCDIVFTPWFKNYKPTMFSAFYQDDLKANPQFKNIFSSEYKTRFWCLNKKYGGSYTWERSSRL